MGVVCTTCSNYQEDLQTQIIISKDHFTPIEPKQNLLQQIQALADEQLPNNFQNYHFYQKNPDTYYIGSLESVFEKNFGILYKPNETLFYGNFLNRFIHGQGEFNEGRPQGKGVLEDNEKSFNFHGLWKGNTKPVSGILKLFTNKTIQKIEFVDFEHGDAQIYYRNGSVFNGFIDKKTLLPHGSGKMVYTSGDIYEGEWANGKFEGIGTYIWKTGEKYNGEYFQGLRNGEGDFYFASGKYFKGAWKDGKKQGHGKILAPDGKVIQKGIYHEDIFDPIESQNFEKRVNQKAPFSEVKSELVEKHQNDESGLKHE